ncbi:MAG: polysaccharide pyruvyl transferase family protein [Clostridia bacterium]|nr:polysaccharide pyruvyl transferase family protein [Clostridia bacterium]
MKIITITFHRAINYGAILQTYALQKKLEFFDENNKVLDYRCQFIEETYSQLASVKKSFSIKSILALMLYFPINIIKKTRFRLFIMKNIRLEKIANKIDWDCISREYDAIITGSDQVWNYKCTNFDKTYFLGYTKPDRIIKASYAASFGLNEIPEQFKEKYSELLKDIRCISVRESQGAKIVYDLLGYIVPVILDPTMLLCSDEWDRIAERPKIKGDYILLYLMVETPSIFDFAFSLSKRTNCKVVFITDSVLKKKKATYRRAVSPGTWVGLFKNANYVVTNSFHGTAFSVIYEKKFFVELLPQEYSLNSRFENLLDMLNLRGRLIVDGNNAEPEGTIDYDKVNAILKKEREKSTDFLKRTLRNKEI